MNESGDFIKVYVKSKKVPSRAVFLEYYSPSIIVFVKSSRSSVQFEDRLDEVQKSMLEDAEGFAHSTGIPIKVVDLSKLNVVSRLIRRILNFPKSPTIVLQGAIFSRIFGNQSSNPKHSDESSISGRLLEEEVIPLYR
jgi:hypothetical protein